MEGILYKNRDVQNQKSIVENVVQNNQAKQCYEGAGHRTLHPQRSLISFSKSWARPLNLRLQQGQTLTRRLRWTEFAGKHISYLDGLTGLARATDVMTSQAAEDLGVLREPFETNLRNKTLREFVSKVELIIYRTLGDLLQEAPAQVRLLFLQLPNPGFLVRFLRLQLADPGDHGIFSQVTDP